MSRYLFDTDIAIEVLRGGNRPLLERLAASPREDIALSVVTLAALLGSFEISPLTTGAAESSARASAGLEAVAGASGLLMS
ncbi:MAG: hypothetical protein M3Y07_00425 [Acidobacteriota bacterium]|nr:hypothetical protein [Acidobacteriota bacterium]